MLLEEEEKKREIIHKQYGYEISTERKRRLIDLERGKSTLKPINKISKVRRHVSLYKHSSKSEL